MVEQAKTWIKENSTLVYFLIAQFIGAGALVISMISYMVNLEARVATLETRGSPHLSTIDNRLTVLESQTKTNKDSIERIVDVMTKELGRPVK
jgi:uncharacterized coiled-coil protein SlyX